MNIYYRKLSNVIVLCIAALTSTFSMAQVPAQPKIQFILFSGADCPPCVAWKAADLPKIQAMEIYKSITYISVSKTIRSQIPPRFFLPNEVKPLKEKLDIASDGRTGSPLAALVVDGEVYDFWFGVEGSDPVIFEQKIKSILLQTPYPVTRCLIANATGGCKKPA